MIMSVDRKTISFVAVLAALYAVLTLVLSPVSYGPLQFRFADILQPFVLKGKKFVLAIALGTFLANLNSPFGVLDFGLMPLVSLLAGFVAYRINKINCFNSYTPYVAMCVFAAIIACGVGWILNFSAHIPFVWGFFEVFITVAVINMLGIGFINKIVKILKNRGIVLEN